MYITQRMSWAPLRGMWRLEGQSVCSFVDPTSYCSTAVCTVLQCNKLCPPDVGDIALVRERKR